MSNPQYTGARIREMRMQRGVKQAQLAQQAGISPAYLNLIEHDRRRIAGKTLNNIARALGVEAGYLAQGVGRDFVGQLQNAAAQIAEGDAVSNDAENFANRQPDWARLVVQQHQHIDTLEQRITSLIDRLSHDPHLSEFLHEILSTATAIRSTASILSEPGEMDKNWQRRFQDNIFDESKRLAQASHALVQYLDTDKSDHVRALSIHDELNHSLEQNWDFLLECEKYGAAAVKRATKIFRDISEGAESLGRKFLEQYFQDAVNLPMADLQKAIAQHGFQPDALHQQLLTDIPVILRRLAYVPPQTEQPKTGLIICDNTGVLIHKKAIDGFHIPRFGAGCGLWPVYGAFSQPLMPVQTQVQHLGGLGREAQSLDQSIFETYSIAVPVQKPQFNALMVYEAVMLVVENKEGSAAPKIQVGATCRICAKQGCAIRREPSILLDRL